MQCIAQLPKSRWILYSKTLKIMPMSQVLPSDLFVCFKWPFQGLSDLHLGYQPWSLRRKKLVTKSPSTWAFSQCVTWGHGVGDITNPNRRWVFLFCLPWVFFLPQMKTIKLKLGLTFRFFVPSSKTGVCRFSVQRQAVGIPAVFRFGWVIPGIFLGFRNRPKNRCIKSSSFSSATLQDDVKSTFWYPKTLQPKRPKPLIFKLKHPSSNPGVFVSCEIFWVTVLNVYTPPSITVTNVQVFIRDSRLPKMYWWWLESWVPEWPRWVDGYIDALAKSLGDMV